MATETASTMETVETDLQELNLRKNHNPVLQVQPRNKTCFRCSREGHEPKNCWFRSATCRACGKRRHIQVACRTNWFAKQQRKAPVRRLQDETGPDSEEDEASSEDIGVFKLYANSVRSALPPVVVEVALNGKRVTMEVDTGAAMSLISEYTYQKYIRAVPLAPTDLQLHTHTDEKLEVQGKCSVSIEYRGQVAQVSIYVVAGRGPSLLGRVVVPKKDGHIRLCGDYKVTINPLLTIDSHPLPKPQELFASLAGGERFTKLDLSQAYQQMRLDQRSKELVTINTH